MTKRESADIKITNSLNKESEERKKADTALQNEIDDLNRLIDGHVYGFKREIANSNYLRGRSYDRYAGLINDNGTFKVKLVPPYPTPSDSADAYSDYINTELVTSANGFVKEANCSEFGFLPQIVDGSASTYFCDYFYKNDVGVKYVLVGGNWYYGSRCGRYVYVSTAPYGASVDVGSRLSYTA